MHSPTAQQLSQIPDPILLGEVARRLKLARDPTLADRPLAMVRILYVDGAPLRVAYASGEPVVYSWADASRALELSNPPAVLRNVPANSIHKTRHFAAEDRAGRKVVTAIDRAGLNLVLSRCTRPAAAIMRAALFVEDERVREELKPRPAPETLDALLGPSTAPVTPAPTPIEESAP